MWRNPSGFPSLLAHDFLAAKPPAHWKTPGPWRRMKARAAPSSMSAPALASRSMRSSASGFERFQLGVGPVVVRLLDDRETAAVVVKRRQGNGYVALQAAKLAAHADQGCRLGIHLSQECRQAVLHLMRKVWMSPRTAFCSACTSSTSLVSNSRLTLSPMAEV